MRLKFLFFLLLPAMAFSQKANKNDIPTTSLDSIVYNLAQKTLAPSAISLPFKHIEIADARFDTSKLGYEIHRKYDKVINSDFKRIKLDKGIQGSIQYFYNDYYSLCLKDTRNKLLIVIKTLWIDNAPLNDRLLRLNKVTERESYQNIHVKWEYYIEKDNKYFPFKRVDTVYQLTEPILTSRDHSFKKNDLSFFLFVLKSQLEQIDFGHIEDIYAHKRSLTFNSIDSFNRSRLLLPVIHDAHIKTGVFQDFNEFKNNIPGIDDYELKKTKQHPYWVNRKNAETIKRVYLMCDSSGIHIGSEKRVSVIRVGNTFEFFLKGDISRSKTVVGTMLNTALDDNYFFMPYQQRFSGETTSSDAVSIPRQINMETGEVY